jgi:branched-chain amino acid transport system permease protein
MAGIGTVVNRKVLALVLFCLICVVLGETAGKYSLHLLILTGIYMILTTGFSVLYGQGGLISLAYAAFYGIGAYTTVILEIRYGLPGLAGLPVSFIVSGFIAYLLAWPLGRLKHLHLAVATLAFSEICMVFFKEPADLTGGYSGIAGVPPLVIGSFVISDQYLERYYYFTCLLLGAVLYIAVAIINGKVGRAIRALRDNETAAQAMGINPTEYKAFIFAFTSGTAGIAGWLYAHYALAISPPVFSTHFAVLLLLMLFIGGLQSLWGAVLGATFLTFIPDYVGRFGQFEHLVYGFLIIIVLMFLPRGLIGIFQDLYGRLALRWGRLGSKGLASERE